MPNTGRRFLMLVAVTAALSAGAAKADTLSQVIGANPNLSTFASLVRASGLESTLAGPSRVTVFAPTNDAFDRMPFARFSALRAPGNAAELRAFVSNHLVPEQVQLVYGTDGVIPLNTVGGTRLSLRREGESTIWINEATRVLYANLRTDNGNIHVVDGVLAR